MNEHSCGSKNLFPKQVAGGAFLPGRWSRQRYTFKYYFTKTLTTQEGVGRE